MQRPRFHSIPTFTELEKRLLNDYQHGFPLSPTPYADIACDLNVSEDEVLACLTSLSQRGMISRIGPVIRPKRVGTSTLAAVSVPEDRLEEVAQLVSSYPEVNHNYEREHAFNLWFVITASDQSRIQAIFDDIRRTTGLRVLDLPMEKDYHIDLGFPLWC